MTPVLIALAVTGAIVMGLAAWYAGGLLVTLGRWQDGEDGERQ